MGKAKYTLTIETDLNFDLIGICSHFKDYRIVWLVNQQIDLQLKKSKEPFIVSGKKGEEISSHSLYEWIDDTENVTYYFIQNKDKNKFLIPEMDKIDYFLVIKEAGVVEIKNIIDKLKENKDVLLVMNINVENLKSASRFIF